MALVFEYIGMRADPDHTGDDITFAIGEIARLRAALNSRRRGAVSVGTQTDAEGWIIDDEITVVCASTNNNKRWRSAESGGGTSANVKRRRHGSTDIVRKAGLTVYEQCRVMAKWNDGVWYHGRARKKNRDGSFVVDYDDGDTDKAVAIDRLRVACSVCDKTTPHRWVRGRPWTCVRCARAETSGLV
jgi:hypothetical protein